MGKFRALGETKKPRNQHSGLLVTENEFYFDSNSITKVV